MRFKKLYTSFISYANDRLSVTDNLFHRMGKLNKEASFDVALEAFDTYWGGSLVADYLRVNPDGLSRTDLREIAQFGHAISGTFIVVRDGRDVLFLIPGFQIAVRGLIQEIDTIIREDLPVLVETVLLPFRNTIAFAFVLETHTDHIDTLEPGLIDDFRADSQIIRSARDLILHEEAIKRAVDQAEDIFFADKKDDDREPAEGHLPDDEICGQHRGSLAGLRGKDRVRVMETMQKKFEERLGAVSFFFQHISTSSDMPVANLREFYLEKDTDQIVEMAKARGIEVDARSMSKQELVDFLYPHIIPTTEEILSTLRGDGMHSLLFARELHEAGGRLEITQRDACEREFMPAESTPIYFYRATRDSIVATMVDEIARRLDGVDWDAEIERVRRLDEARHYFEVLVDLRGVDVLDEAYQEYLAFVGGPDKAADKGELFDPLLNNEYTHFTHCFAYDIDGTTMLVNYRLRESVGGSVDEKSIRTIIQMQQDKPRRPVTPDMLEPEFLNRWVEQEVVEVQDMIAYLDEHVPDTQDDLSFADDLSKDILIMAQMPTTPHDYTACMRRNDFFASTAQISHLTTLITEAANHQPCWINRGWSPADMREMIDRGEWTLKDK